MHAIQAVAPHSTPLFTAAVRLVPAGAAVIAYALATGRKNPSSRAAWGACLLFGLVDGTCFQGCLAEGLERTAAGLGSVIIDSQPLTVAAYAALFMGERMSRIGVAGLALGVAGLLLLELPPDALQSLAHLDFGTHFMSRLPFFLLCVAFGVAGLLVLELPPDALQPLSHLDFGTPFISSHLSLVSVFFLSVFALLFFYRSFGAGGCGAAAVGAASGRAAVAGTPPLRYAVYIGDITTPTLYLLCCSLLLFWSCRLMRCTGLHASA